MCHALNQQRVEGNKASENRNGSIIWELRIWIQCHGFVDSREGSDMQDGKFHHCMFATLAGPQLTLDRRRRPRSEGARWLVIRCMEGPTPSARLCFKEGLCRLPGARLHAASLWRDLARMSDL